MPEHSEAVSRLIELANEYVELASIHLRRDWDISKNSQLRGFGGVQDFREALRIQFFFPELPAPWRDALMELTRAARDCETARQPYREPLTHEGVAAAADDLAGSQRRLDQAIAQVKGHLLHLVTPVQQDILRQVYLTTQPRAQD